MSSFLRLVGLGRRDDKKEEKEEKEKKDEKQNPQKTESNLSIEEIRERRLRALQSKLSPEVKTPSPKITSDDEKSPKRTKVGTPEKKLEKTFPVSISKSKQNILQNDAMDIEPSPPSVSKSSPMKTLPLHLYIHEAISRIFKISLVEKGEHFFHLKRFARQTNTEYFTMEMVEPALVDRLSAGFNLPETALNYLTSCYARVDREIEKEKKRKEKMPERIPKLEEIKDIIVSYFGLIVLHDDVIPLPPTIEKGPLKLIPMLMADYGSPNEITDDFLRHLIKRFKDDGLNDMFNPIFMEMYDQMRKCTLLSSYTSLLGLMVRLTGRIEVAKILVSHQNWLPLVKNGYSIEHYSILGPFFSLTSYPEYSHVVVGDHYFGKVVRTITTHEVHTCQQSLRMQFNTIHNALHKIMLNLLLPKETREQALEWISHVIEGNKSRLRMIGDRNVVSTEGFMSNFCVVLLKLAEPATKGDKMKLINPKFVHSKNIVDWTQDTKVAITEKEANEWYEKNKDAQYNFVTQIFFYTHRAIQLGIMKAFERYQRILRILGDTQRAYDRAKQTNSLEAEELMRKLDTHYIMKWSIEAQLLHPSVLESILAFYTFSAKWILTIADPQKKGYPLSKPVPMEFAILPEFMIDTISEYLIMLARFAPRCLMAVRLDEIFNMMIMFMSNEVYIRNPYVRAKFPEVIAEFTPFIHPNADVPRGVMDTFVNNEMAKKYFISGMMKLYVDIEHTGASNQFYNKFTPRYFMSLVLRYLWSYEDYRKSFTFEAKTPAADRFFNMLLNDAIFLLDESLKILADIKKYETEFEDQAAWMRLSPEQRRERETNFLTSERQVISYMLLANETVQMLNYTSKDVPEPYMRKQMIDRVANMLNYFLVELAGPKCQDLKVKQPEKYHFDPKKLLTQITDTYLNFAKFDSFIKAVASDGRSYRPDVFERTITILRTRVKNKSENYIREFEVFALKTMEEAQKILSEEKEIYNDVPDEFLDPITFTIMEDPVLLPSNIFIDRATIERHLLNDNTDPFTKQHLTIEMLKPATELKEQIEKWKQEKKK